MDRRSTRVETIVKFRVEREVLADAVAWVARGLPNRPPVPVLSGVLIEADRAGTVTLSAFDYEVSAKVTVAADVDEGGTVLVTGRLLVAAEIRPGMRLALPAFDCSAELVAGYAEAGGKDMTAERVKFWEIFGTMKWGIMCKIS